MVKQEILLWLIGASLSKPQTGVTSLCPCVCMFAWILLGPTTYCKSLPVLICTYASCINSKQLESEDLNHGQSTSLTVTTRMETTHGLAYSVARAIEVTAWQSVDAVCLCCLTHCFCVEVTGQSLLTCRRWLGDCPLSMPSPPAACVGPTCVQHALYIVARPDSLFVYMCVLGILWPEIQSHPDDMQSYAFNCSMFCTCTRSGSPHSHALI